MQRRSAFVFSVVTLLAVCRPHRARASENGDLPPPSPRKVDETSQVGFGFSIDIDLVNTSTVRVPAARAGDVKLPSSGRAWTLDALDFRVHYGRPNGWYFPLGGVVYSCVFGITQQKDLPDGSTYNADTAGSIVRLFTPGVGHRWTGKTTSFGAELSPSIALFEYPGTIVSAPIGRFGGHYLTSHQTASAKLVTLDASFLACANFDRTGRHERNRPPSGICLYGAPILYEWSSAGSSDVLQGVRFGVKLAVY
jgi:hypothetical protein